MYRCLLRVLTLSAVVLSAACATSPKDGPGQDPEHSSTPGGHEIAIKVHEGFARDFEEVGNDAMAEYHRDRAAIQREEMDEAQCGFFCTVLNDLLGAEPDNTTNASCGRDPVTRHPSVPSRC